MNIIESRANKPEEQTNGTKDLFFEKKLPVILIPTIIQIRRNFAVVTNYLVMVYQY